MKTTAKKGLSNNLKLIMLTLGFFLGEVKKSPGGAVVEKTYKSSDYSTTFTASRVARVSKERDNTKELAFGSFLC